MSINELGEFIEYEKIIFNSLKLENNWNDSRWDVQNWLPHRGAIKYLTFNEYGRRTKELDSHMNQEFGDWTKSIAIHINRNYGNGFIAVRNYVNICRRLFSICKFRGESSPRQLTKWHFDKIVLDLKEECKSNIYNECVRLKIISDIIDKFCLSDLTIGYVNQEKTTHQYYAGRNLLNIESENDKLGDDKLPSYESMKAYAVCTNNPINLSEEILLRTIDLLFAMGQRINEVLFLPLDCIVEVTKKNKEGTPIIDGNGIVLKEIGIRYYPEKHFEAKIHWLSEQDIPFAMRAIDRLKILTKETRQVAKYQEESNRLWNLQKDSLISEINLLKYLGFENVYYLSLYLKKNNIPVKYINKNKKYIYKGSRTRSEYFYCVGDIEDHLYPTLEKHIVLQQNGKIILRTSDLLSICFDGSFRFKREANTFKVLPRRVLFKDIAGALGNLQGIESIFERRKLVELDGSKIKLTTHQPRHWRNTLYDLAGMSNVNQALALGRKLLDQNTVYQHPTVKEITSMHRDFLTFNSIEEKQRFIKTNIREGNIVGDLTDTYHSIRKTKGVKDAETFLSTHANALHITPYGACTHDFSLNPCQKHLECWNGCTHLHLTGSDHERKSLKALIETTENVLAKMIEDAEGEYNSDIWIHSLEKKLQNMKISLTKSEQSFKGSVFPDGLDLSGTNKKESSV